MYLNPVPASVRILAVLLLLLAGIAAGAVAGLNYESNRRDAQDRQQERESNKRFLAALVNGKQHVANFIEWQNKTRTYYRNWTEALKHETDSTLAQCQTTDGSGSPQGGIHAVLLSPAWVGLYNAAWTPDFAIQGDSGGAAYSLVEAGAPSIGLRAGVTPREALDNIKVNAELCGDDRKRLDELIDHLNESEALR